MNPTDTKQAGDPSARSGEALGAATGARSGGPPVVLSIAGSDPTGGAGLQADMQVFRHFGVHGAGVVTALTVQDSHKVHQVLPAFPSVVLDQLRVLLRDLLPAAVKIGMLATDDVARNVLLGLAELAPDTPVVIDPVLAASDGTPLLERRARGTLADLLRNAALVTPNLPEAEQLCGRTLARRTDVEEAARQLVEQHGARAALVKGGHGLGPADDVLAWSGSDGTRVRWLEGERIEGGGAHGTGCALSSAIAAQLALGLSLVEAVEGARAFVQEALRAAARLGGGAPFLVHP